MNNPLVSVVVPTYNRHAMLRKALRSLTVQETNDKFSYEIVVVDNGSTEPTRAVVAEIAAGSRVALSYVREEAGGYPEALNRGVREARGMWVALFDDDQLAEANWLKELLSAASLTKAKLVGGSIRPQLPSARTLALSPFCRGLLGESAFERTARVRRGERIPSGGNMMIAREVFNSIGLFDTAMVLGGCDSDFVERAVASGIVVAVSETPIVHHVIPPYRVTSRYFRWASMRSGCDIAYRDCKKFGRTKMSFFFTAKTGQAILVNLPLLILSVLARNATQSLHRRCLLWRAIGYARETASLATRSLFRRGLFISRLEFRKERTTFSYDTEQ